MYTCTQPLQTGGYTPSELVRKCKDANLSIISLTDHDTTNGIKEAKEEADKQGITLINGIELSTKSNGKSVHMLGYGIDETDITFQKILAEQRQMREKRLHSMLQKFESMGIDLIAEDVLIFVDGGSIGRPHLAMALMEKGYVEDVAEAFNKYLAEGKPCYVEKAKEFSPEEAITIIKEAGGLAIVAHPVYYDLDDEIPKWIRSSGLDGVEVYHRDHNVDVQQHYEKLVEKLQSSIGKPLLKTGGSDFHHETYGRKTEPLGSTTISASSAEKVIKAAQIPK